MSQFEAMQAGLDAVEKALACRNSFFVEGTNGGRMTCGAPLTDLVGHTEIRLCPQCTELAKSKNV